MQTRYIRFGDEVRKIDFMGIVEPIFWFSQITGIPDSTIRARVTKYGWCDHCAIEKFDSCLGGSCKCKRGVSCSVAPSVAPSVEPRFVPRCFYVVV